MLWSLIKAGTNDPKAGRMKSKEVHFAVAHAPLTLNIMNKSTDATKRPNDMKLVAKMLLHTM